MKFALITVSSSAIESSFARKTGVDLKLHIIFHFNKNGVKAEQLREETQCH